MSEFSDQLKARADLGQLLGEVVALKPGGNGLIGLCPFHSEKTPSFHVHTAKRFYYCFGCHAHGDIFQFFMELRKITFPEAVALVAEHMGVELPQQQSSAADPQRRELLRIHALTRDYFVQMLADKEGSSARSYLASREFSPAQWGAFHLGYAPGSGRSLTQHLQAQGTEATLALRSGVCQLRRESAAAAQPSGGARWDDLYDRFRDRLMFPIAGERGDVIAFGGRALESNDRVPKYLNSPEHPLYTKGRVLYNLDRARAAIRELGYAILVEGYFDCLRVFLAGFENVVASCGTALTPAQVALLGRLNKKVAVNFDPDVAGRAAAERSVALLLEEGFQMRVVVLEGGLDPDLFLRRQGREAYAAALKSSRSFFDYLGARAREQFDAEKPEGKIQAINFLLPFLSHVHEPILRQGLAENLAAQLGIDQPLVSRQLLQAARQRRRAIEADAETAPRTLYAERVALRAWLEWELRRSEIADILAGQGLLDGLPTASLLARLQQAPAGADWQDLTAVLTPADQHWLAEIVLNTGDPPLDEAVLDAAIGALRERRATRQRQDLQARIAAAAARGDRAGVEALLRQKSAADAAGHDS
ncbi:MAG: DNA primase [Terriglobales bacterium]